MKTRRSLAKGVGIIGVAGVVSAFLFVLAIQYSGKRAAKTGARQAYASTKGTSAPVLTRNANNGFHRYGKLPLTFEENLGQTAREVRYLSRGSGYELFLTPQEAVLALRNPIRLDLSPRHRFATILALRKARLARQSRQLTAIRLGFEGANPEPQITGMDAMPGKANYFFGNDPKKWHTDIPAYARVKYAGIYPGIDLLFYGNQRRLEYDFVVAPGADPQTIKLHVEGAKRLRVSAGGELLLSTGKGEIEFQKPVIYQQVNGKLHEITGGYAVAGNHRINFTVGEYDHTEPLILDPVLNYSTYLGGSSDEDGAAIAVDANGNAVVAGTTFSADFPTSANGFQTEPLAANVNGASAAFVSEFDPTGTQLKYSTYLAGSIPFEFAFGVDVDTTGMIYVTGTTVSTDFPTGSVITGFKPTSPANVNGTSFITKLDPTASGASSLLYSSYIGGTDGTAVIGDIGQSVAADPAHTGIAYVTGYTDSTAGLVTDTANFPVVSGFQTTLGSPNGNAFLAKIDTTVSGTSSLLYSTYLGGNAANFVPGDFVADIGDGVAVDSDSNAYLAGVTFSTDLATTANALQLTYPASNTTGTAFVARVDTTQTGANSLGYLSYLGGTGPDFGDAIALGPGNVTYVTGQTKSLNFPTTPGAFSATGNAMGVAYVTLVDTTATAGAPPVYSTFLGGSGGDDGLGIRADLSGNAYVGGGTSSIDFPITPGAFQQAMATNAPGNGFLSKVNPAGNGRADLVYSSYFGGSSSPGNIDEIEAIAIDSSNNVYVAGQTFSSATFPIFPNPGAFQAALNGTSDAFVAKLTLIPTLGVAPPSLDFGSQPVSVTSPAQSVTLTNNTSDPIPFSGSNLAFSGSNAADFASPSNTCGASIAAGTSCTVSVTFTPSAASAESATLAITVTITDGGLTSSQSFSVSLSGTGSTAAPSVGLSPTNLTFGGQLLTTTSAPQTVTLTNTGASALTINSIAASGDFAQTNNCPLSPATLAATGTCTISVTFAPTAVGPRAGTLTITDNAAGSPQSVALSGTGWDFTLSAPSPVSIKAMNSVEFPVTMTPLGGFNQAVALACSVALKKATCTVNPASVTAGDGVTPQTADVNAILRGMGLMMAPPTAPTASISMRRIVPLVLALLLLSMLFTGSQLRTRLGMATAMLLVLSLAGCGYIASNHLDQPTNGLRKGMTTLTITGSSGGVTKTVTVTLTVKQ